MTTLCIQEAPKRVIFQTVKTQMKCSIMLHFIRVYTVCIDKKKIFRQKISIFFENYNLTPLDMYNGLYQIKYVCICWNYPVQNRKQIIFISFQMIEFSRDRRF